MKEFDQNLVNNLDTLQNAFGEELREAEGSDDADPVRTAAVATAADFRLNRLYAELRSGDRADTRLSGVPLARGVPGDTPLSDADWARLAGARQARVLDMRGRMRGAGRSFTPSGRHDRITMLVAEPTTAVDQTLSTIRASLLAFGVAGLLLALGGGYWIARRALRPVEVFTAQAGAMASSPNAGARLDVPSRRDELARLGVSFNTLLERLEQESQRTRAFIADAAHELKTPVAIVRTEAQLALSGDGISPESREALASISSESVRLSRLVSDLTLLAEGETFEHPLELRLVDMTELVHDVVRSLRSLAASRDAAIEIDAAHGLEFRGDERLLRQILVNLVENAIKFSRSPSRIGIVAGKADGHVEVRVLDEASTLSAEERERVFERFYRSERERREGGSGLGLAIVRWAVHLHGGNVRVEPRGMSGNQFIVVLPASPLAYKEVASEPQ